MATQEKLSMNIKQASFDKNLQLRFDGIPFCTEKIPWLSWQRHGCQPMTEDDEFGVLLVGMK